MEVHYVVQQLCTYAIASLMANCDWAIIYNMQTTNDDICIYYYF